MRTLLLFSNSTMPGHSFFNWPRPYIQEVVDKNMQVLFIPYAAVTFSFDRYEEMVKTAFGEMHLKIKSIHHEDDKQLAIQRADAIAVGGGNTFALLTRLYADGLLEPIASKVNAGVPYIGWSAGSNVACPTIMTTNDMPIANPPSFNALNLVPFQINPHYTEFKQAGHGGETRMQRLEEFLVMNPKRKVIGLPEGTMLHVSNKTMHLRGRENAILLEAGKPVSDLIAASDISYLLNG